MALPRTTKRQQDLILFLYRFRYSTINQLQIYLGHKSPRQLKRHLKYLKEHNFLKTTKSSQETSLIKTSTPAVFCIGRNGIRFVASLKNIKAYDLKNRYKDGTHSQSFINHQLLLTDVYVQLRKDALNTNTHLTFHTKGDYEEGSTLSHLRPDAYIQEEKDDHLKTFLIIIIDDTFPQRFIKRKIRAYIKSFTNNTLEVELDSDFPTVLIISQDKRMKTMILNYTAKVKDEMDAEDMICKVTTFEKVLTQGMHGDIWKRIKT